MDAVCIKGDWDVILQNDESGQLAGVLVYHHRKYRGFNLILMPPVTAYNGIYLLSQSGDKSYSAVSEDNKVIEALIDQLPKYSLYYQQYHPAFENWLSLYWKDYKETTRYTYTLDSTVGQEEAKKSLRDNLRRSIKNADKHCELVDLSFETFWEEASAAYKNRQKEIPINKAVLESVGSSLRL